MAAIAKSMIRKKITSQNFDLDIWLSFYDAL